MKETNTSPSRTMVRKSKPKAAQPVKALSGYKTILVPIDFSKNADEAVRSATDIAVRYGASVALVHVFQPVNYALPEGYLFYGSRQLAEVLAEAEDLLAKTKKRIEASGVRRVDTDVLQGVTSTEIVRYARDHGCDLIVMGTHGRTGIEHAIMGSVAERVVRTSECPVLTVRGRKKAS